MTTAIATNNGRGGRKSLADQIDRLDGILDGLAGALNDAVVQAVRQAVTVAVKTALSEALAHPELRQRLTAAPAAEVGARPSVLKRLTAAARRFGGCVVRSFRRLPGMTRRLAVASWRLTWTGIRWLGRSVRRLPGLIWRMRKPVFLTLCVGGLVAWGCFVLGPLIASAVGGLAGAAETLSARARRLQMRPMVAAKGGRT
jgi:hypothetical protein